MLIVHHLAQSQSERIVWLCEELELSYQLKRYDREPSGAAPANYKALHPFGTAPVIEHADLVLGESGAIVEYVCRVLAGGRLMPEPGTDGYADALYWFHFAKGSFIPAIMLEMFGPAGQPGPSRIERALAAIESRLAASPYFGGRRLGAADIMMCLPRFLGSRDLGAFPAIRAYLEGIVARPAHRRCVAKAEPGTAA